MFPPNNASGWIKRCVQPRSILFSAAQGVATSYAHPPHCSCGQEAIRLAGITQPINYKDGGKIQCLVSKIIVAYGSCEQMRLYQVVGRKAPTENDPTPQVYRMKLFAQNEVIAKSRFWYFMHQMRKMKKTTGEILDVNEVHDLADNSIG